MTLLPSIICAQSTIQQQVDSLVYVQDMPYICEGSFKKGKIGCGDKLFWDIVEQKDIAIEPLIHKLGDTTKTKLFVANFGEYWTVADIAYTILQEIIKGIPTFELLEIHIDKDGYYPYWRHLRADPNNRSKFKYAVVKWYEENRRNLTWVSSNEFMIGDCSGQHLNGGHYELIE